MKIREWNKQIPLNLAAYLAASLNDKSMNLEQISIQEMICKDQQVVSGGIAPVGVAIPFLTYPMIKFGLLFFRSLLQ